MKKIYESEFLQLSSFIKEHYGIDLTKKKSLVTARLQNILKSNNYRSFSEYNEFLMSDVTGEAISALINRITTNHTFFMREHEHFRIFKDRVMPYLISTQKNDRDLRIWSAGCSSGEEPYTLAMIIDEFLGNRKIYWDTRILATDISGKALDKAVKGEYPNHHIEPLPIKWKLNYFKKIDNERYIITDNIKKQVIFRRFNLMAEKFPFKKKFHVIFCRNVMIYFDSKTREDLVNKFYNFTEHGGYLFIGHSESLNRDKTKYRYVLPSLYRKE